MLKSPDNLAERADPLATGILIVGALLLAYANGANDNFKATATVYGSGTLNYKSALTLSTVAQLAGSVASVFFAEALLKAFSGKGLVPVEIIGSAHFLTSVAIGAALTVLIATWVGLPISTTHAIIGGLVGGGVALAPGNLAWSQLGAKYFLPLLLTPLLALVGTATLYPIARSLRKRFGFHAKTCLCIGSKSEEVQSDTQGQLILCRTGTPLTIDEIELCRSTYDGKLVGISAQHLVDSIHKFAAFALGFARGLNDTPKVMALLLAVGWSTNGERGALVAIALVMAIGGLLHSRKIAETMGHKITDMNCGQGAIAGIVSSSLVIGASMMGSGVSTTHVSNGSIFGIGLWSGSAKWKMIGGIVLAWVATLPMAAALAYLAAQVVFGPAKH